MPKPKKLAPTLPGGSANRVSLALVLLTLLLGLLWIGFAKLVVPRLIASAYRGESWSILNRMITGQASHALSEYLVRWHELTWIFLGVFIAVGLAVVVVVRPEFWQAFWQPATSTDPSPVAPMSRPRLKLVYALLAFIVAGSLYDFIVDVEHWPFSPYPMYSDLEHSRTLTAFRLFGVTDEGAEISLHDVRYLQPFDNSRLPEAFQHVSEKYQSKELKEAVADCFLRYEALRRAGRHSGPRLQVMRVYRVYWVLDPWARNIDHPDRKDLLAEVRQAELTEP